MSRVLIVHADEAVGARLAAALHEAGLEPTVVTSGESAMDRFIQDPADVIVIDYDLGGRDGVSAAEAIRWMPGGRRARLILTASREPEEGDLESLGAGLDAYAIRVGLPDPPRVAEIAKRAAAVRPHEAETRVLDTEEAQLEADKMRAAASDAWDARPLGPPRPHAFSSEPPGPRPLRSEELEIGGTLEDATRGPWELPDADGREEGAEVERVAFAASDGETGISGTFETLTFARVLNRLAEARATGALVCMHPPDERATTSGTEPKKIVYFRAGVPAHVRSNLVRECLGQVLQRQRKIGRATLRESVDAVRRGEGRQGEVLVRMGAISPVELSEALAEQLRVKLFDLFFWERGSFRFAPNRPPPAELIDLEMGLAEIVFRGTRLAVPTHKALERLRAYEDRYVVGRARKLVRFVQLGPLGAGLGELIRRVDGSRTLRELLDSAVDAGEAAQMLYAMECLEAIAFAASPTRARSQPPPGPSDRHTLDMRAPDAASRAPADARGDGAGFGDLADMATLADLPPHDGLPALRLARAGLGASFVVDGSTGDGSTGDGATVDGSTVDGSFSRGSAVDGSLVGSSADDRWVDESSSGGSGVESIANRDGVSAIEPVIEPAHDEPDTPRDPIPVAAEAREEDHGAIAAAGPDEPLPAELLAGPSDELERVLTGSLEAPPGAYPDSSDARRLDDRSLDEPEPSGSAAREPPELTAALDLRVESQLKAERVFRRGVRRLDRGDPGAARTCFEEAAALCPEDTRFALHLTFCAHALDPSDGDAHRHALEAAEAACAREPGLSAGHLLRARLLRAAGREDDARAAYGRVLELEPGHKTARSELRALNAAGG